MGAARDLDAICAVLQRRLPDGASLTGVRPLSAGFSNETYLLDGLDQVLRLPPAGDPLLDGHGVVAQAHIYQAVREVAGGPPAPRVLHVCDDASVIGDPFFVMERVVGNALEENQPGAWFTEAPADFRAALGRRWIEAVGRLAHLSPLLVLGAAHSPEDEALRWREAAVQACYDPLVRAFDRLLETPAPRTGAPSVVHGDTKVANTMWRDGELAALLDWEMAYNGEPLADLGYSLYFFDSDHHEGSQAFRLAGMPGRARLIEFWSAASGRSAEGVAWYEALALGKLAAIMGYGFHLAETGRSSDFRFKYFGPRADADLGAMLKMLDGDPWFGRKSS